MAGAINYNMCQPSPTVIYDDRKIKSANRFCISSRRDAVLERASDRRIGKYCGVRFVIFTHTYVKYTNMRTRAHTRTRRPYFIQFELSSREKTCREKLRDTRFKSAASFDEAFTSLGACLPRVSHSLSHPVKIVRETRRKPATCHRECFALVRVVAAALVSETRKRARKDRERLSRGTFEVIGAWTSYSACDRVLADILAVQCKFALPDQ